MQQHRLEHAYRLVCLLAIVLIAAIFAWVPVVYDTLHLSDTLFLAEIGWRVYNGLEPALDFGHLYGGVTAKYIATAMAFAGPTIKALDYAALMQCATAVIVLALVSYRRVDRTVFATFAVLCVAVMLARAPLEEFVYISTPVSGHSFIYNRFGTVLMICVGLFVILPAPDRRWDNFAAIICGGICFVLMLIKSTLFLPSIAVVLGLLVQERWRHLLIWTAAFLIAFFILDPRAERISSAWKYSVASVGQSNTNLPSLLRKTEFIFFAHQLSLVMALGLIGHLLILGSWPVRRVAFAALVLLGAYCGTAVSFGQTGIVGHQALPMIAGITLAIATYAKRELGNASPAYGMAFALSLSVVVVVPHMANTMAVSGIAVLRSDKVEIHDGPMANYLAYSWDFPPGLDAPPQDPAELRAAQVKVLLARTGGRSRPGSSYAMLVDGIELMAPLGDLSDRGIVSGSHIIFSFAMGSRPVAGFPAWISRHAPEFADGAPFTDDVDLVLISRLTEFELGSVMEQKMAGLYSLCRESGIWSLYVRNTSDISGCNA